MLLSLITQAIFLSSFAKDWGWKSMIISPFFACEVNFVYSPWTVDALVSIFPMPFSASYCKTFGACCLGFSCSCWSKSSSVSFIYYFSCFSFIFCSSCCIFLLKLPLSFSFPKITLIFFFLIFSIDCVFLQIIYIFKYIIFIRKSKKKKKIIFL